MKLSNQTAIVTGGASGIGRAISERFAREGARVIILDHNREAVEQLADSADSFEGMPCDVSDSRQVRSCIDSVSGRIDILVNNAGVSHVGNIQQTEEEDFDRLYQINVKGMYNCTKAVIDRMVEQQAGVILNMASIVSHIGIPDRFAYSMSKGAVLTMTYSIACDYVAHNIRCNCIAPARVHTPFVDGFLKQNYPGREQEVFDRLSATQPIGRMGKPEEVANLALFLCSEDGAFFTGNSFPADGGFINLKP